MSAATDFLRITVTQPDWLKNKQAVQIVDEELRKALAETLQYGKRIVRREIKRTGAVATGKLRDSVATQIQRTVAGSWIYSGDVYFKPPAGEYAYYADQGRRRGGQPPSDKILLWMRAKGIDEKYLWPIIKTIASSGTFEKHDFMEDSVAYTDVVAKQNYEAAAKRIQQRLGGKP